MPSMIKQTCPEIVNDNCSHLIVIERKKVLPLLVKHEELFDGTLGDWQDKPVHFELKPYAKPYHS